MSVTRRRASFHFALCTLNSALERLGGETGSCLSYKEMSGVQLPPELPFFRSQFAICDLQFAICDLQFAINCLVA